MSTTKTPEIEIRPGSDVYATYQRLAYKIWYAIGEFVDNSTQNFSEHRKAIQKSLGKTPKLTIDVAYDPQAGTLSVADDANGMNLAELTRAVQLNKPPADPSGRSEFGMGLKMASCWLGRKWRVVTKRLGAIEEYEVAIDVRDLERHHPDSVGVLVRKNQPTAQHYTRIEVEGLYRTFRGQAISRIKEHLASIYRRDIDSGEVVIRWNGEPLTWEKRPCIRRKAS
ncbi:MAG: ATP-binding protein [Chthoniobacterales bacterium]|nr:ATP-binding protein [Chthoniobacterales bacterium]